MFANFFHPFATHEGAMCDSFSVRVSYAQLSHFEKIVSNNHKSTSRIL